MPLIILLLTPITPTFLSMSISCKNFLHSQYFINFKHSSLSYLFILKFHKVLQSLTTHSNKHFLNQIKIYLSFLKFYNLVLICIYFNIFMYLSYYYTNIFQNFTTLYSSFVILFSVLSLSLSISMGYNGAILTKISAITLKDVHTILMLGVFMSENIVYTCFN